MGVTDPLSLADYEAHGGWAGLRRAQRPWTARPWSTRCCSRACAGAAARPFRPASSGRRCCAPGGPQKYVVCNADEGDSGTYSDRMTMEGDPFMLIEGMAIAALAVGATQGYIYIRSEYPHAIATMREAIARAARVSPARLGSARPFGWKCARAPAPMCAAKKPPCWRASRASAASCAPSRRCRPSGPVRQPTVINNVITFASVPLILARGAAFYRSYGMGRSHGTLPFQLAGNIKHGGLVEKAFGVTLRELLFDFGGGTPAAGRSRRCRWAGRWAPTCPSRNGTCRSTTRPMPPWAPVVGHGGIVVHDDTADMAQLARYAMEFCAIESCGKCTPCRIGSTRGVEVIDRIRAGEHREQQVAAARPVRHHGPWLAVRHGRHDAVPGAVGARTTIRRTSACL
jgi:formate dehydrogenase iron-sulfur subunit